VVYVDFVLQVDGRVVVLCLCAGHGIRGIPMKICVIALYCAVCMHPGATAQAERRSESHNREVAQ
jgi:hypothetical protein